MTSDQRMQAITEAATPGPWEALGRQIEQVSGDYQDIVSTEVTCGAYCQGGTGLGVLTEADAAFITAARDWVPAALDRIDLVRELHQPLPASPLCQECLQLWPCPTLRIIDGDGADQ